MSSIATVVRRFGAVVLVVGLLVGLSGVALEEVDSCESGAGFVIYELDANETVDVGPVQRYSELNDRQQRQFDDALAELRRSGEDSATSDVYEGGTLALENGVVVSEGTRYEVWWFHADCGDASALPMLLGVAGSAAGFVVFLGGSLWEWFGPARA